MAHLAFCAAAIFLFAEALIVRVFFCRSSDSGRSENSLKRFVQRRNSLLITAAHFELADRQVVYIRAAAKYSKPVGKSRASS